MNLDENWMTRKERQLVRANNVAVPLAWGAVIFLQNNSVFLFSLVSAVILTGFCLWYLMTVSIRAKERELKSYTDV